MKEEQEIWKAWPHLYNGYKLLWVSNLGRVSIQDKLYDFSKKSYEHYYTVCGTRLHRMVAILFCNNPYNYNEVDHINGNPRDNRACNLRWVTHKGNMENNISRNRQISSHTNKRYLTDGVVTLYLEPKYWDEFIDIGFWFKNSILNNTRKKN